MKNLHTTSRWSDPDLYRKDWDERNQRLLDLFLGQYRDNANVTFSEYGCGPNRPFAKALAKHGNNSVQCFDFARWPNNNIQLDLNEIDHSKLLDSDVGVFSGVLEYLNSIEAVFETVKPRHSYILLSYSPLMAEDNIQCLKEINKRSKNNGFRNHHSLKELLTIVQRTGYLIETTMWGNQVLLLIRVY